MEKNRNDETVALERYKIISPILTAMEENADKGKIGFLKSEACGLADVSRKTLNRWIVCYAQEGLDGLKYHAGSSASKKKYPAELISEAILLRREVPSRSISQIIEILEMEGKAPKGFLKRATLCDRLRELGYSSAQMKLYQQLLCVSYLLKKLRVHFCALNSEKLINPGALAFAAKNTKLDLFISDALLTLFTTPTTSVFFP